MTLAGTTSTLAAVLPTHCPSVLMSRTSLAEILFLLTAVLPRHRQWMLMQEIGLAGMLSILTAVLLDTTGLSHMSASEPDYTALPHNFCSVAASVLR